MKTERHADSSPLGKLRRCDITLHRQTSRVRLEILSDGHDVARDGAKISHQLDDLVELLSESDHDAALRQHAAAFAIAPRRRTLQKRQRLLVDRIGTDAAIEPRDSFR